MNKIAELLQDYTKKMRTLQEEIQAEILRLPDNPNINRVNDRCFIINSSQLKESWAPFFYDWKAQYRLISSEMQRLDYQAGPVLTMLSEIVQTGKWKGDKFAPEVREFLKTYLAEA